ncbi:hypothetical protein Trydic_g23980 [Trypoxylus dichotomus]
MFQSEELEELHDPCQTSGELSAALDVDQSCIGKRLHALGMVQKARKWVPDELKKRDIKRRLVTCEMLPQNPQAKDF